jgi:hypothetical protein
MRSTEQRGLQQGCKDSSSGRAVRCCPAAGLAQRCEASKWLHRSGACTLHCCVTLCCRVLRVALPAVCCRPLSKTVRFNVLRVIPAGSGGDKKGFSGF